MTQEATDAARYRWMRERHENTIIDLYNGLSPSAMEDPEGLDAAVDEAMRRSAGREEKPAPKVDRAAVLRELLPEMNRLFGVTYAEAQQEKS
jgi:hypothetical protein